MYSTNNIQHRRMCKISTSKSLWSEWRLKQERYI